MFALRLTRSPYQLQARQYRRRVLGAGLVEHPIALPSASVRCWIGGEEIKGGKTFEGSDPGELTRKIGTFQKLGATEAKQAVEKAHEAFGSWKNSDINERVAIFMKAAQMLRERQRRCEGLEAEVARLQRELAESAERQAALAQELAENDFESQRAAWEEHLEALKRDEAEAALVQSSRRMSSSASSA